MKETMTAVGVVADLELRQRVRSVAWYVLLGVAAAFLAATTVLLLVTAHSFGSSAGEVVVSVVVYLVLLLGTLVTPALSGGAVNADRDAGTLATTQVTLVSTFQLLMGKFLAAWAASLAFLVVASPFLVLAITAGGVQPAVILTALGVTAIELGVIAAVGVGLSAVIPRPIFSVVTTYLIVAALSVGTVIVFALGGLLFPKTVTYSNTSFAYDEQTEKTLATCTAPDTGTYETQSYDRVWWVLAANPYAVLADAVPGRFDRAGNPVDAFSSTKYALRQAQIATPTTEVYDDCDPSRNTEDRRTPEQRVAQTAPSWFVGLTLHVLLGAACLLAGLRALRTPARRLARGSRIA